jgi:anti-anti-sigma regulatory factor
MFWVEQNTGGEVKVRFGGVLDASSAREVRPFLSDDSSSRVTLDFSQAADVDYHGLAVLVAEVIESGRAVHVCGICMNHVRMLRYLGFDPAKFGLEDDPHVNGG